MQKNSKTKERNQTIVSKFKNGDTIPSLAQLYTLSPQRIQQILKAFGISARDGGQHVRSKPNKALCAKKTAQSNDKRAKELYGVSHETYKELRKKSFTLVRAFTAKKHSAQHKDIPFTLTLQQWFSLWEESGKSHLFGRGEGKYCLGRIDDSKGFSATNVEVVDYKKFMVKTALNRKK